MVWLEISNESMKIGIITSAGGHLFQIYQLRAIWKNHQPFWVTFEKPDVRSLIPGGKKYFAYYPESRHPINAIKNFFLAIKILYIERPDVLISAGAGIAVSFFLSAKLFKIHTIYLEPVDFIQAPSLTGKILYKFKLADLFLIQHKKQKKFFPKAKDWGSTL